MLQRRNIKVFYNAGHFKQGGLTQGISSQLDAFACCILPARIFCQRFIHYNHLVLISKHGQHKISAGCHFYLQCRNEIFVYQQLFGNAGLITDAPLVTGL